MKKQVEICTGSYYDCMQASLGGAKRVELNSALHLGGLTPSVAALRLTKKHTDLSVMVMIRPRGAGFCYNEEDFETMLLDTDIMLENGADGIVFGCLDNDGNIAVEQIKQLIAKIKAKGKEVIFHRAFDCVNDPYVAIETLIALGVDRILTSGLEPKAIQGKELLKDLQATYGDRIELLAGSGINAYNAVDFMEETGITQVHSSCKDWLTDATTTHNHVSFAYGEDDHIDDYEVVSKELVEKLIHTVL